jgi:hypothetical protein
MNSMFVLNLQNANTLASYSKLSNPKKCKPIRVPGPAKAVAPTLNKLNKKQL